jgi:hypothetical protein
LLLRLHSATFGNQFVPLGGQFLERLATLDVKLGASLSQLRLRARKRRLGCRQFCGARFDFPLPIRSFSFMLLGGSMSDFGLPGRQVVLTLLKPKAGATRSRVVSRQIGVEVGFATIQFALPLFEVRGQLLRLGTELLDD